MPSAKKTKGPPAPATMRHQVYAKQAKKVDWGTAFAQPVLAGARCLCRLTKDRDAELLAEDGTRLAGLAALEEQIRSVVKAKPVLGRDFKEVVLDGWLCHDDLGPADVLVSAVNKDVYTDGLGYVVFDAAMGPANFETRNLFVRDLADAVGTGVVRAETVKVRSESDLMIVQQMYLEQGRTGVWLHHGGAAYEPGKESPHYLLVDTFKTGEFAVVDYKFGRGRLSTVPIFVCQTKGGDNFDVQAPGPTDVKKSIGTKAAEFVGKKLTVRYHDMSKTAEPVPLLPVAIKFKP